MFRQFLFLTFVCIFYSASDAQLQEKKTEIHIGQKSILGDSMIVTVAMLCSLSSVLIILIPTTLYYKYCAKKSRAEMHSNGIH